MTFNYCCPVCGSDKLIYYNATASWDAQASKFVLQHVNEEDVFCNNCGGRTSPLIRKEDNG